MAPRETAHPAGRKRGVLLLIVLSMLTLFLMLGAAYMLTTSRAWEAARAYSRLTLGTSENRIPHARLLDDVMLQVIRGSGTVPESLLADKYGSQTSTGTMTGCTALFASGTPQPLINGTVQTGSSMRPTDLVGRILTFNLPGRASTSHRIIKASRATSSDNGSDTSFVVTVDASGRHDPFTFPPATTPVPIIMNGREFSGDGSTAFPHESWDAFDSSNDFLAQVQPSAAGVAQSIVFRGSLLGTSPSLAFSLPTSSTTSAQFTLATTATSASVTLLTGTSDVDGDLIPDAADNDNDGVVDGAFRAFSLPDIVDANGNTIQLRASVLVVDLDSRLNLNAHDSLARVLYSGSNLTSGSHANWPAGFASGTTHALGSGYGPAEIDGSKLLTLASGTSSLDERPLLQTVVGGGTAEQLGLRPTGSRYTSGAATPRLAPLAGRYGETPPTIPLAPLLSNTISLTGAFPAAFPFPRPGAGDVDDAPSRVNDRQADPSAPPTVNYGVPPFWWFVGGTTPFNWAVTGTAFPPARGVYNSPPDLHGSMKSDAIVATGSAIAPTLRFAKADWPTVADPFRETRDDPYETQLDTRHGRGGYLPSPTAYATPADNPFTPAELEPVLRPYDVDTWTLPPRLATMLGSAAEAARFLVTTESWDTTAIVGGPGGAAGRVFGSGSTQGWLQLAATGTLSGSSAVTGLLGGEVARGEKFNLNRALMPSGTATAGYNPSSPYYVQRQAYFKDLYTLLVALEQGNNPLTLSGTTVAKLAQWAANVVEFRDADSIMTPFEYDTDPRDGWDVDGDVRTAGESDRQVVWGVERPEILLRTTFAWRNNARNRSGMLISLHRPWKATALASGTAIDAEPCDYSLDTLSGGSTGIPTNSVDLAKKPSASIYDTGTSTYNVTSGTTYPIWRLRIVAGGTTRYVRLDTPTAAPDEFAISAVTPRPTMPPNSTLTLHSGSTIITGSTTSSNVTITSPPTHSGTTFTISGLQIVGTGTTGTVYLERLSDPSQPLVSTAATGSTAWYADPLVGGTTTTSPVRYIVVDSMPVVVAVTDPLVAGGSIPDGVQQRRVMSSATSALWLTATSTFPSTGTIPFTGTVTIPPSLPLPPPGSSATAWLPWNNRPFISAAELMLVPQGDALAILRNYQRPTPSNQATVGIPIALDRLFDAVHVPTRFAGIHTTGTHDFSNFTGIFNDTTPVNQYSSFREPGRVNLNTVVSGTAPLDAVWNAVVAGRLSTPVKSGSTSDFATTPGRTLAHLLALSGTSTTPLADTATNLPTLSSGTFNPAQLIHTATRLANTVTPRSNVFAVWVTLRESIPNDPDSVKYHRAFYIIDRSLPVGFEQGRDHNVMDCVRVRRIIE